MSTHPEVLWAQRSSVSSSEKNIIYLTINLPDIIESTLEYDLTPTSLSFKARTSGGQADYAFALDLFAEVDPELSTRRLTSRSLVAVLRKKESKSEYWPRLTKEKIKTPYIKTDFSKWVDEDEQDGNPSLDDDLGVGGIPGMDSEAGMDFSKLGGDFNPGGFNPSDFNPGASIPQTEEADDDSDDDGPPPLEDAEPAK